MEISFSKIYEHEAITEPKLEIPIIMDHDSGYISHNPESNSDSSMENPAEAANNSCLRPIYLSEDALLEKPDITVENTKQIIVGDSRNKIDSPELIPSSVVSQESYYTGFENESDSEVSMEIPTAKQLVLKTKDCNNSKISLFSNVDELVNTDKQNKTSDDTGIIIASNDKSTQKISYVNTKQVTDKTSNEYCGENISQDSSSSNDGLHSLNNITNTCVNSFNENEAKKRLTLIFSKCNKENVYSVKRKYQSLSPDEGANLENFNNLERSKLDQDKLNNAENIEINSLIIRNEKNDSSDTNIKAPSEDMTVLVAPYYNSGDVDKSEGNDSKSIAEDFIFKKFNCKPIEKNTNIAEDIELENALKKEDISQKNELVIKEFESKREQVCKEEITEEYELKREQVSKEEIVAVFAKHNMAEIHIANCSTSSISITPEKKYVNSIDPNISPDLFDEEETVKELRNEAEEKYILKKDLKILKKAQSNTKGVLPPLSMTVVQMSVNEMLNRLESNKGYFWSNNPSNDMKDISAGTLDKSNEGSIIGQPTSLLVTGNLKDCINKPWPNILEERYHGLHFNRSKVSEQFEELCVKYGQRYVGAETQSSCTVFEMNFVSPVKRKLLKQRWPVKSPGRRLSHLAKRRITFSGSNLQAGTSSVASSRARQILVDARKLDILNRRRSPKKSPRKTPRKSPRVKSRTPSSSAKKKLAMRFRALAGEIENTSASSSNQTLTSKRALFRSPNRDKNSSLFLPSTSGISTFQNDLKNSNTKRTLFISPSKNSASKSPFKKSPMKRMDLGSDKKRKRFEADDPHPTKMLKADIRPSDSEVKSKLGKATTSDINVSSSRNLNMQNGDLSAIHKKKLYWAVYEALRTQNISPTHAQFKIFASVLARVTRRFLPNLNGTSRPEGSTSERMLRTARLHVFAVVKGKSVDEIVTDYVNNRARNAKPQGYVGIEEFNEKNKEMGNKENAVKGRVNTIESLEKKKLEQLGCDNRIERIRKVINFGDDNR